MVTMRWTYILALFTTLLLSGQAYAAVTAQVDRYNINVDETVNFTIEVSGDDNGEPDITPLQKAFEILSQNKSSSYSLINGSMSSKTTWFLTLRPRHAGTLTIPALQAGKKQTAAITIQVSKTAPRQTGTAPQGELWIDIKISPETVHVQQQTVLTLLIYQSVPLNQAQLSEPKSDRAMIVRLGEDKSYQLNRNGKIWTVTERRYAVFPMQHGLLKLDPVQLDGTVLSGRSSYGSAFQTTRPIRVRSNALELDVEAMPADWKSNTWLPATDVQLTEDWPTGEFKVGDSITRTLTLTATGLISSQLPELSTMLPDHLKAYADKPVLTDTNTLDGVTGQRQEKLAILATRPGTFILPPIDIDWWNPETQSVQTVSLPARTFKVLPAPVDLSQPNKATPKAPGSADAPVVEQQHNKPDQLAGIGWKWIALLSTLGWLITLVWLYRKSTSAPRQQSPGSDITTDRGKLKKAVSNACQQNHAKTCEQALLNFAKAQWPNEHVNSLASFAKHCDAELLKEVNALELHLYGKQENTKKQTWHGSPLQSAFENTSFTTAPNASISKNSALPTLYPE
ncbi:MAG: BatD family protein [Mariprofundus sp.]|nr:BatD family protein [Mariprofundus sp.]